MELTSTNRTNVLYTLIILRSHNSRVHSSSEQIVTVVGDSGLLYSSVKLLRNKLRKIFATTFLSGDSFVETPVPIPNTVVKHKTPTILTWRRVGKIGTAKVLFLDS